MRGAAAISDKRFAFEPLEGRFTPSKSNTWTVIPFSKITDLISKMLFKTNEDRPFCTFSNLDSVLKLRLLSFFDLPELAAISSKSKAGNSLVCHPIIWRSIAARIGCPINEATPEIIYKQVLNFIASLQIIAAELLNTPEPCSTWFLKEELIQFIKKPTIAQIKKMQQFPTALMDIFQFEKMLTRLPNEFPSFNFEPPQELANFPITIERAINTPNLLNKWLSSEEQLIKARDTLAVWKALAKSADLLVPSFADLDTKEAVINRAGDFQTWFEDNKDALQLITKLTLKNLHLTSIPDQLGKLRALQELDFSGSLLTRLPNGISNLANLRSLECGMNLLTFLPKWIDQLTHLQKLNLSGNRLSSLPDTLGNLKELATLDIQHNQLSALPMTIGGCIKLETLILSHNQLTTIPEGICDLKKLKMLTLNSNLLSMLPEKFGQLENLETLDLSENYFSFFPESICLFSLLRSLSFKRNLLSSVPASIGQLVDLKELDLQNNRLEALPKESGNLAKLKVLKLGKNLFTSAPDAIRELVSLKKLDLRDNRLATIPPWLAHVEKLKVENNPLPLDLPAAQSSIQHKKIIWGTLAVAAVGLAFWHRVMM